MWSELSITSKTPIAELVDRWLRHLRAEGRLEDTTINEYERVLRRLVVPELGDLPLRELTTSRMDAYLDGLRGLSVNRRRKAKVVTGAMLELAVGLGALETNPVRGTASVVRPKTDARPPLTLDEVDTVRAAVCAWTTADRPGPKASRDMADLIDLMLATGARIGEALAIRWSDIELETEPPALNPSGTIKTEPGQGTYRKLIPGSRTVALPTFAVTVLLRRLDETPHNPADACLPDQEWHLATGQQRRTALAADPAGHRTGVGHPTRVSQGQFR